MHSEHIGNLHPGWVIGGWLVSVGVTGAIYIGGIGLGLVQPDSNPALWVTVSLAGGFFAGGLLVGMRWSDAPILHGTAITLFSVLVWFLVVVFGGPRGAEPLPLILGSILIQLLGACAGGWTGRRMATGQGAPGGEGPA